MPGGQRYLDLACASRAKNASVALVNSPSVAAGMPCPVICMKPDRPGGLVDLPDDLGAGGRVRVGHAEAGDVDHGNGEDTVAQGG